MKKPWIIAQEAEFLLVILDFLQMFFITYLIFFFFFLLLSNIVEVNSLTDFSNQQQSLFFQLQFVEHCKQESRDVLPPLCNCFPEQTFVVNFVTSFLAKKNLPFSCYFHAVSEEGTCVRRGAKVPQDPEKNCYFLLPCKICRKN